MPKTKMITTKLLAALNPPPTRKPRIPRRSVSSPTSNPKIFAPVSVLKRPPAVATPPAVPLGKQAQVLALLRRPAGATIAGMMAATGWMSHSVRGLLSAVIKRKLGLVITSTVELDRGRVYRVVPSQPVTPPPTPPQDGAAVGLAKTPSKATTTSVRRRRTTSGSDATGTHEAD